MSIIHLRFYPRIKLPALLLVMFFFLVGCNEISLNIERSNGKTMITMGPDGAFPALRFAMGVLNVGVFEESEHYTVDDDLIITSADGTELEGNIFVPTNIPSGTKVPAILLINSWALNKYQYLAEAAKLAEKGYIVLSYSTRGFGRSGGIINTAGPKDIEDLSAAIDFLLANYPADPNAIGSGGISYGSGISLIGAAHDPRIKAVVALSSWGSLDDALFANDSPRLAWGELLVLVGDAMGKTDPLIADYWNVIKEQDWSREAEVRAWTAPRSPLSYLAELNANNPAIYLGKAYGDNLFRPNSVLELFSALTVDHKHIDLVQGTHASAELVPTVQGIEANYLWRNAFDWFDIHLKGETNDLSAADPVRMKVKFQEQYDGFSAFPVSANEDVFYLHPRGGAKYGELKADTYNGATLVKDRINSKAGSMAFSTQIPAISQLLEQSNIPIYSAIPFASNKISIAFRTDNLSRTLKIRGNPNISVVIEPDHELVQVVAYLYDMDSITGLGRLITHGVSSLRAAVPDEAVVLDFDMVTTAYDVPAGNRLVVAFDTQDAQYMPLAKDTYNVNFNFISTDQSTLTIPKP